LDEHSLQLLEFDRVTAAVATLAESAGAARRLSAWRPIPEREARARECALLREAIRRNTEPGVWCEVGRGIPGARFDRERPGLLDGEGLVEILGWLEAGRAMRTAWADEDRARRFTALAACVSALPELEPLRAVLAHALEPDGHVADRASPKLGRARRELAEGERQLEEQVERWAKKFGENGYATRHGDRFVALVPAAGFPRRRGIVHDVSGSGQSLFVEPLEACERNNRLIELRAEAAEEERRILIELAEKTRAEERDVLALEEGLTHLDSLRARARWAADVAAVAIEPAGARLALRAARHPLLAMGERRDALVPLDLELSPPGTLLLVSGPNMGGKTVLLKTVGLTVALAHAAFPVPAEEGSAVPELAEILADLGDEQSVDRGLSTFAAHLERLKIMSHRAGPDTLILCDELGAGTDPDEGGALGRALVEHFAARGAWAIVTTHLGSLKHAAAEVPGVLNGSLDFDVARMTPLYRFLRGVPGASHALAVAERLGLDPEVVARARALTPESARSLERLIAELQDATRRLDRETKAADDARREAERQAAAHHDAAEHSRRTLEELRRRLTRESEAVLGHARELWQTVQREARRADKSRSGVAKLRAGIEDVERQIAELDHAAASAAGVAPESEAPVHLAAGERVRVRDLGVEAELVSGPDPEGRVLLRRGAWNIHSHVSRLEATHGQEAAAQKERAGSASWEAPEAPSLEVDLRGMEADEALQALDQVLDRAVVSGFSELRIIHGIGRGVLRAVVERHLRGHPQVASQRLGGAGEGGRGATVAILRGGAWVRRTGARSARATTGSSGCARPATSWSTSGRPFRSSGWDGTGSVFARFTRKRRLLSR